jgi:hypothetical protein
MLSTSLSIARGVACLPKPGRGGKFVAAEHRYNSSGL